MRRGFAGLLKFVPVLLACGALFSGTAQTRAASAPAPATAGSSGMASVVCAREMVWLRGPWGQARFSVEVADTNATRNLGLMNRDSLPGSAGMLFVYDSPRPVSFWMEDTRIALDMLFFDQSGRLLRLHENAIPYDRTTINGGDDVLAVLELNGGMAAALGVTGAAMSETVLAHPAFAAAGAALPCDG